MSAVSGKQLWVGTRHARVFDIDANGRPAATDTTAYEGTQAEGIKGFNLTPSDPRVITHLGDDNILQNDMLPPNAPVAGEITISKEQLALYELLTDIKVITEGEAKFINFGTDQDGDFPQVALHVWGQALDASGVNRSRRWRSLLFPCCFLVPRPSGFGDNPLDIVCRVIPQVVTQEIWGITRVLATHGCASFQYTIGMTEFHPKIVAWKTADATPDALAFPTGYLPQAAAKVDIFTCNGLDVLAAATIAPDLTTITPDVQDTNDIFTGFYEYA